MVNVLLTIFWGIVLLSLLVVIHEGGHYLAARAFKVRVLEFMVGLPGPSIGFRPKNSRTRFGITCVPLGGYARIAGMDETCDESRYPQVVKMLYEMGSATTSELDEASKMVGFDIETPLYELSDWGTVACKKLHGEEYIYQAPEVDGYALGEPRELDDPEGFIASEREEMYISLPWWKRLVILFAGPCANLLTAIIVVTLALSIAGGTQATTTISDAPEEYPAYAAGMRAGDTIVGINGIEVETWTDFSTAMEDVEVGDEVEITYTRDGEEYTANIVAVESDSGTAVVGVTSGSEYVDVSVGEAFMEAITYIGQVAVAIVGLINPATTMDTLENSTSVIGISVLAKEAADAGFLSFIWMAALISVSLGLMNLLPLMPLDGGRIVVETIQKIIHRPVSLKAMNAYTMVGMALVMVLFVAAMGQDITTLVSGGF